MKYQWMEKILEKEIGRLYSMNVSYGTDSLEELLIDDIFKLISMLMKYFVRM
jgi:hypothetical protein